MITIKNNHLKIALLFGVLFLFSCNKEDDSNVDPNLTNGVASVVSSNFSLSLFGYAMNAQKYNDVLSGKGPFTLIVPSNAAFIANGYISGVDIINASDAMSKLLPYCIVNQRLRLDSLPLAFNQVIQASNGLPLYVTHWQNSRDTAIVINGARISTNDRKASNGLVNVADAMLNPPIYADVHEAVAADADLSLFNAALNKSGLVSLFAGQSNAYTVFAPRNAAFIAIGIKTTDSIYKMDPDRLKTMVLAHLAKGRNFVYDYILKADVNTNLYTETMLDNSILKLRLNPDNATPGRFSGVTLVSVSGESIPIVKVNILTKNGLVNKIGTLLKKDF